MRLFSTLLAITLKMPGPGILSVMVVTTTHTLFAMLGESSFARKVSPENYRHRTAIELLSKSILIQ